MITEKYNKALARVILSTKRKNREYSLIEIAKDIKLLQETLGSVSEVAKVVGISSGMLHQFLSVLKLPKPVLKLIIERKIDSVSAAHYLSKFNADDIVELSRLIESNKLNSQDIRVLLPFRRKYSNEPILELVNRIHSSKNIKISVIRISKDDTNKSIDQLKLAFEKIVGSSNLMSVEAVGNYIDIKLLKKGEQQLRKAASANRTSLQGLVTTIIQ